MGEMQQLKESADKQRAMQRIDSAYAYVTALVDEVGEALYWSGRGTLLMMVALLANLGVSIMGFWLDVPKPIMEPHESLSFIVFIVAFFRSMSLDRDFSKKVGEFEGAMKVLELLGMMRPLDMDGTRKKRKVWNEGVDLVKSWFTSKKTAQEKVYAPA